MREVKRESEQTDHAAVTGHATFPHAQDRQWLAQHFRFVEENVTEPATNDHAKQRRTGNEVGHFCRRQIDVTAPDGAKRNSK